MKYDEYHVNVGIDTGIGKISEEKIRPSNGLRDAALKKLSKVLDDWPYELNGRFVKSFAETVMIAEASREYYEEPQLDKDLIVAFLAHSIAFFNSWTHP